MRHFHFLTACILILMGGCTKDLPLPSIKGEKRIVLQGELVAGDTVSLRGGISLPVAEGSVLESEYPTDLTLTLTSPTEPPLLIRSGAPDYNLKTIALSAPQPIGSGVVYSLHATCPDLTDATAEIDIPQPFEASILDTATVRYGGTSALRMTIRIRDRPGEKNFYTFEALRQLMDVRGRFEWEGRAYDLPDEYLLFDSLRNKGAVPVVQYDTSFFGSALLRLNTYTDDDATENVKLSSAVAPVRRVLLSDAGFDGGTYDLRVYVDRSYFTTRGYDGMGRIIFWVKSVSADYFRYLRAYETFTPTTGLGVLAQPVRIEGNIRNGYGVVGGVYRLPFYYVFDRWPY